MTERTRLRVRLADTATNEDTAAAQRRDLQLDALHENPLYAYVKARAVEGDPEALSLLAQLGDPAP
jgi:hypothetical protein